MNKQFFIFTDGSAIGNPGPAGWAAIVIHGTKRQEIAGSVPWSTVSEMELRAAVEALRLTPTGARIELRSDSELLIDGMRFLVFRWQRFGWRNSRGFELQHQELWRELISARSEQFAGDGSGATAAIRSNHAQMHLPTKQPEQPPFRNELPPDGAGRPQLQ
jgi:ribonuclease HI